MRDFLIPDIKEKMDQFLIDNPSIERNSEEYLKHYRKLNYQEKKEQYKAYQKDYRVKIKSAGDSRFIKPTEEFIKDLNRFIYSMRLKELVTLTELLKIVVYWSDCNDRSPKIFKFKKYNQYSNNKQLELMWKDINMFNDRWKKLIL